MRDSAGHGSLGQAVYAEIRAELLSGLYEPGSRLSLKELALKTEVSPSVVREALARLAATGLVVAEPQLGFCVMPLTLDDVQDLSWTRIVIEGRALREAIAHADVEYETRIVASHHRLARTPEWAGDGRRSRSEEWSRAHVQFHEALISACPSRRLCELAEGLRETSELYTRWAGTLTPGPSGRNLADEHRGLMDAALDRDAARAEQLISEHISASASRLVLFMTESPAGDMRSSH